MVKHALAQNCKGIQILSFILLTSVFIFSSAAAQELKRVRFGYPSLGFRQGHIWVAKDEGYLKSTDSTSIRFSCAAGNWRFRLWRLAIRRS